MQSAAGPSESTLAVRRTPHKVLFVISAVKKQLKERATLAGAHDIDGAIDATCTTIEGAITEWIERLHDDVLFPAFKRALTHQEQSEIESHIERRAYPDFREPARVMVLTSEHREAQLRALAREFPRVYISRLAMAQVRPMLSRNEHWGHMIYRGRSGRSSWPLQIELEPDLSMNEEKQWRKRNVQDD